MTKEKKRCQWVTNDPLNIDYHDKEWGVPVHDDQRLFEFLILEGAQAGLSWITILKKRENYRAAFNHFDAEAISRFTNKNFETLMQNPGIIRNRLKISATIENAKAFLKIKDKYNSFAEYIWGFVDGKPITNKWSHSIQVPTKTVVSDRMAKELKKQGFKFVGTTICYAYMQAVGMVNDHLTECFRYKLT
jgi:DNA-3-methyladenine glycosylase I